MRVGGLDVHARVARPPDDRGASTIVLVHGLGVSSAYMVPVAGELARDHHVVAPDLPGHGRSATPRVPLDIPALARALLATMDALGIGRPVLLGNSLGCQVVVELAATEPERAEALVLVGPTVDRFHHSAPAQLGRLLGAAFFERPRLYPIIVRDFLRMGPRAIAEARAALAHPMEERLASVRAPSLVVRGGRDLLATSRWTALVAQLLRTEWHREIPGRGHALNHNAPAALAALVRGFLHDVGARPRRPPDAHPGRPGHPGPAGARR